jgi:uncharacterized protein (TIGR00255 family)
MIRSMTGFGSASATADGVDLSIELRSVNSRHLKLHFRLPPGTESWEEALREEIAEQVRRGHVDVTLRMGVPTGESGSGSAPVYRLDEVRARAYIEALRELQGRWGLGGEVDIGLLARCERLFVETSADPVETVSEEALREVAQGARAFRRSKRWPRRGWRENHSG